MTISFVVRNKGGLHPNARGGLWGLGGEHYWYGHTEVWKNERLLNFVPREVVDAASRRGKTVPHEEYHHITVAEGVNALHKRGQRSNRCPRTA